MTSKTGAPAAAAPRAPHTHGLWARYVDTLLGAWLFFSAFVWPHSPQSRQITWSVGLIIIGIGISAMVVPAIRWLNTALAIWLFVATLAVAHYVPATIWNNVLVAVLVFALSFVPNVSQRVQRRGRAMHDT